MPLEILENMTKEDNAKFLKFKNGSIIYFDETGFIDDNILNTLYDNIQYISGVFVYTPAGTNNI